ncbi:hypothetical protein Pelo_10658 [Pelomyxa schiedti]|nr:hypothetical protein Pelo_10658 [Pelomyxa schiedti]
MAIEFTLWDVLIIMPLAIVTGVGAAGISFTAWTLMVPVLFVPFGIPLFETLFISASMDVTSSFTLALLYGYRKKLWPHPIYLGIFCLCAGGMAALTMWQFHPLLLEHEDVFKGGVGYVSFVLGAIFLTTGIWKLIKVKRADWAARRAASFARWKAKLLRRGKPDHEAAAAAAEAVAEGKEITADHHSPSPDNLTAVVEVPRESKEQSLGDENAKGAWESSGESEIHQETSITPSDSTIDQAAAIIATTTTTSSSTLDPPAENEDETANKPENETPHDEESLTDDQQSEHKHKHRKHHKHHRHHKKAATDTPLLTNQKTEKEKPVRWCGKNVSPFVYVPVTGAELLFIGGIAGMVGFGGGTWFSVVIVTNLGVELLTGTGTGCILMCATMLSLDLTLVGLKLIDFSTFWIPLACSVFFQFLGTLLGAALLLRMPQHYVRITIGVVVTIAGVLATVTNYLVNG